MSLLINVGQPQLVVHSGRTVWAAEPDGQVTLDSQKGLLLNDTRLISQWRVYANGARWELMNGGAVTHFAARVFLCNTPIATEEGEIAGRALSLVLARWIDGGVHEDLDLTNHSASPVKFNLELAIRSDFADLFEVKSNRLVRRGRITSDWDEAAQHLTTAYNNADFHRAVNLVARGDSQAVYANGRLTFEVALAPGETWHTCLLYDLEEGDRHLSPPDGCIEERGDSGVSRDLEEWRHTTLKLRTSNEEFYRLFHQAVDDMAALQLPVEEAGAIQLVPVAGLPWFVALFGRDSLIVSLQTAPISTAFARGALEVLGARQALERDDFRDAEPGKILHELRAGELAHFKLIPHTPYFGTADATALYLMVLHNAWKWTGDRTLLERHLETAEHCLTWIDDWGDRDADGFQEYQTRSPRGYENMGWKDAQDAVLYPDGSMVRGPKALCELQGYVYAAWNGMAEIYGALGRADRAAEMRTKAAALFERFNEAFWDEDWGGYAYALDGDKQKVLTVSSNIGHCLWTGLVRQDRAARVVQRLMAPDMFSGWGIRTLSAKHPGFNPYAYHNGSVWPHDNGLIAQGFKRYGFTDELSRVARGISGAASFFALHQVPELFAGIDRSIAAFPVQCLGANVPQAWAAGAVFSFLQAILGLRPDAPNGRLLVDPVLPAWLPDITLMGLRLGDNLLDVRFQREHGATNIEVVRGNPGVVVMEPMDGNGIASA